MKALPIIFSAPMVRALLDGRKTQTRRLATSPLAKVKPGDLLWVRESVTRFDKGTCDQHIWYRAGRNEYYCEFAGGADVEWPKGLEGPGRGASYNVPSIHMPRWASRLTLEVTHVRRRWLQDISEPDAEAEGCNKAFEVRDLKDAFGKMLGAASGEGTGSTYRLGYAQLWDTLHDKPGQRWDDNPEIVALTFTVRKRNVDELIKQREAA